jgi:hypothetical protein
MNDCCNQKRECASKVAPVKLSYPRYENDDYHTMWREDLRIIAKGVIAMIVLMLLGFVGILAFVVN